MAATVQEARDDLRRLAERARTVHFPLPAPVSSESLRRSAVLILFGALDRVPARSPVPGIPAELDVLLLRRSAALSHHPGQMAFPGGGREPRDCDAAATALREASEETGLVPSGVTVLGPLPDAVLPNSGNMVTPVLGWWHLPVPVVPDLSETDEVYRVPVAELLVPSARYTAVLRRGRATYRGPMFKLGSQFQGRVVWGFTALILSTLFDELGWAVPWNEDREFVLGRP